ncbi:MAG: FkbM family methyltransferase [Desulfitobacterium sp.]
MQKNMAHRQNIQAHALARFPYDVDHNLLTSGYASGFADSIANTYNALGDEQSRNLFNASLSFSLTRNFSVMDEYFDQYLPSYEEQMLPLLPNIVNDPSAKLYIFGAGVVFWYVRQCLPNIKWQGVIDNYFGKSGDILCGLPILRFDEFMDQYTENTYIGIAVSNSKVRTAIREQITNAHFDYDKCCFDLVPIMTEVNKVCERQYFELPQLTHSPNETFVDCGVYDGATSAEFIRWCDGKYKSIFAFEPDKRQLSLIRENLRSAHDVKIFEYGCSDKTETLPFFSNIPSQFSAAEDKQNAGNEYIKVACMDELLKDEEITFIKMDIEGAEYNALLGAEHIIRENKPKLAICVYHRPGDIVKIPQLIHSFRRDYVFYLRHPFYSSSQTVLFAI